MGRIPSMAVRLRFLQDQVVLEIEDDGIGFEVPARWIEFARQGRLGLASAARRAMAFGGNLEVSSGPGQGTRLRVSMSYA
jgi:signal transduction histidine kinase